MSMAEYVHAAHAVADALAQAASWAAEPGPSAPSEGPVLNTDGILAFITSKLLPILLAVIGVIFISRAGKGEVSKVLTSSTIAFIGIAFIVGAVTLLAFGKALVDLILPTPPSGP